jgi:hypothetical protein
LTVLSVFDCHNMSATIIAYTFFYTYNNGLLIAFYSYCYAMYGQILPASLHVVTRNDLIVFTGFFFNIAYPPASWQRDTWINVNDWLYSGSDIGIWLAYSIIPFLLFLFLIKRPQIHFDSVVVFFKIQLVSLRVTLQLSYC